jgi:periplasmic protein TonB
MRTQIAWAACLLFFIASIPAKGGEKAVAFEPPQVVSTVEPTYPVNTVQGGTVVLEVTVSASGAVEGVRVMKGAQGFTREALETIKKWKFTPAKFEGKSVAASIPVAFSFSQPIVWWNGQRK